MNQQFNAKLLASIKVIGVGGGGCNAVNRMYANGLGNVEFWVANTDKQVLDVSPVQNKLLLGAKLSKGLGAGGNPELGKKAAQECEQEVRKILHDTDMLFVACGMGGGTGTGAAPIIAKIARDMDILTVGIVTRPFRFEGKRRNDNAMAGINELRQYVDSIIIIPNDRLLTAIGRIPVASAFTAADTVLRQAVQTITDIITTTSFINLDFADIRATLKDKGSSMFGIGVDKGEGRAVKAALKAVNSPLLESSITGCTNAIVNFTGGDNMTMDEIEEAVNAIQQYAGSEVDVIFGLASNPDLKDEIIVTIIATGSDQKNTPEVGYVRQPAQSARPYDLPNQSQPAHQPQHQPQQQPGMRGDPELNSFFKSSRGGNL